MEIALKRDLYVREVRRTDGLQDVVIDSLGKPYNRIMSAVCKGFGDSGRVISRSVGLLVVRWNDACLLPGRTRSSRGQTGKREEADNEGFEQHAGREGQPMFAKQNPRTTRNEQEMRCIYTYRRSIYISCGCISESSMTDAGSLFLAGVKDLQMEPPRTHNRISGVRGRVVEFSRRIEEPQHALLY